MSEKERRKKGVYNVIQVLYPCTYRWKRHNEVMRSLCGEKRERTQRRSSQCKIYTLRRHYSRVHGRGILRITILSNIFWRGFFSVLFRWFFFFFSLLLFIMAIVITRPDEIDLGGETVSFCGVECIVVVVIMERIFTSHFQIILIVLSQE